MRLGAPARLSRNPADADPENASQAHLQQRPHQHHRDLPPARAQEPLPRQRKQRIREESRRARFVVDAQHLIREFAAECRRMHSHQPAVKCPAHAPSSFGFCYIGIRVICQYAVTPV